MLRILTKYVYIFICIAATFSVDAQVIPLDGYGNNLDNPTSGSVLSPLVRIAPADYADGISMPKSGEEYNRLNSREISNMLFSQQEEISNELGLSSFVWAFGQFISHDISLSLDGDEFSPIAIEGEDEFFEEGEVILFTRTAYDETTGENNAIPREYLNGTTAYIDGSVIYGSDAERAQWLRTFSKGKLKVSADNLLPWNTVSGEFSDVIDHEAPEMSNEVNELKKYYVAGDVRANENPILLSVHTLFLREHNRLCDEIFEDNPTLTDEEIYQLARVKVIGFLQNITFYDWLPAMGVKLAKYTGYTPEISPNIYNEFITAAFQLGQTLASNELIRMDDKGEEINRGNIEISETMYNPLCLNLAGGVEPYLKGLATQVQQEFDNKVVDELRNYKVQGEGYGLDYAAINIERGRDRGLADYNTIRSQMGMPMVNAFSDITKDSEQALLLKEIYGDVNNIDAYVGMLSETHYEGTLFGELVNKIIKKQFQGLRDGDRFYYENLDISEDDKSEIENTGLRDILMRNTSISLMQDNIFIAMQHRDIEKGPAIIHYPLTAAIYPNPVQDEVNIKFYSDLETSIDVTILDNNGHAVKSLHKHVYSGVNFIYIKDLDELTSGSYNVLLESGNRSNVIKMIKI